MAMKVSQLGLAHGSGKLDYDDGMPDIDQALPLVIC